MEEQVILVDEQDREKGTAGKMEAHREGLLHRAFSVFVFNSRKELLIQQRALHKYHSAGLWTNTCCSHPRPGEETAAAAKRRLKEEMGLECALTHRFEFTYKAGFANGLTEHELDHVFTGHTDQQPVINKDEVADFKWISIPDLLTEMKQHPEKFTAWLHIIVQNQAFDSL